MTKTELLEAIKNCESVWVANKYCIPYEVNLTKNHYIDIVDNKESLMLGYCNDIELIDYLEYIFETKEKAQHYHDHANITRTEYLPFLSWEEFLEEKFVWFVDKNQNQCCLFYVQNFIVINKNGEIIEIGDITEANFYKAYDECVKLFKGE